MNQKLIATSILLFNLINNILIADILSLLQTSINLFSFDSNQGCVLKRSIL